MDRRTNRPELRWEQYHVLRRLGYLGIPKRVTLGQIWTYEIALGLESCGLVRIDRPKHREYADISLTEAGRAIAG